MRIVTSSLLALSLGATLLPAQQSPGQPLPALAPEALLALEELTPRYAREVEQIDGWFRDRAVRYYDFGRLPTPVPVGRVLWPIHGFDANGDPVAIRGQRPIFSTIPGLDGYSGLWKLEYVVTADYAQPNALRTLAAVDSMVRRRRATLRATDLVLNLPIVPRGSRLMQDSTAGSAGWYQGREVQFFDFGAASPTPAAMWRFARGTADGGEPMLIEGQGGLLDSIPVAPPYPDLWTIRIVRVDSTYAANAIRNAAALRASRFPVDSARVTANLPVTILDGVRVGRAVSPLTEFADMRSPFPPAPTTVP